MQNRKRYEKIIPLLQLHDIMQGFLKQEEIFDDLFGGCPVRIVFELGGINLVVITIGARINGERQGAVRIGLPVGHVGK